MSLTQRYEHGKSGPCLLCGSVGEGMMHSPTLAFCHLRQVGELHLLQHLRKQTLHLVWAVQVIWSPTPRTSEQENQSSSCVLFPGRWHGRRDSLLPSLIPYHLWQVRELTQDS